MQKRGNWLWPSNPRADVMYVLMFACMHVLSSLVNLFWDMFDKFVVFSRRHVQHVLEIGNVLYGFAFIMKDC